ncbi:hypothetical protein C4D60_Mb06t13220 [Musa balbisiana]|uniref:AAA+ ATPase domain-containing protein n=1 Tax=Musa balbisiana TaxID=52838 RepID=A0A4S8ING3_MUSBA|nr:hypothetical protein C4D60_Mb06t13220 [Musa balbisiana]
MMMETMSRALDRAKMLVGMESDEESLAQEAQSSSFFDEFDRNCTLSTKQRLYGFAICLSAGLACTILSMLVFFNPIKFGITFTFGNLLALGSTAFLIGPKRQIDMMLDPVRIYATSIYIASMIIALFCAFYVHNKLLTLLAIILEFGALIWYSLSYIPFARSAVSKVMVACFDTDSSPPRKTPKTALRGAHPRMGVLSVHPRPCPPNPHFSGFDFTPSSCRPRLALFSPTPRRSPLQIRRFSSPEATDDGFVVVEDDLHTLLEVLPRDLRENLQSEPRRDQLLEVILDLGRRPEARFLGESGGQYLRDKEISLEELEEAQKSLGEFGGDNRAGIEGTLHRISAIRSRKGLVVGLTCRVGRAVSGHVDMVRDLLEYRESILFLGRPGVGKTTVMREIARVLADELHKRVVIVDTSNEIGGDGDIPHAAIGGARRMQVGGVETVTLGDDEARARRSQKSILERKAPPTFPFLIEMRERNYWVTHRTERSVDMLLTGKKPLVEIRKRDDQFKVVVERWKTYDGDGI